MVGNRRRAMVGVPRARTSMGNGWVSGEKGGRGRELTEDSNTPRDLKTVSCDNGNDRDVTLHVPVVGSAVGAVPTLPAVEFRDVGVGVGWARRRSTTTMPLALPSSWEVLPVVVVVFGAARPRSRGQIQCLSLLLQHGGTARSRR